MSARRTLEFCGAFEGRVTLRPGETAEQAAERVEEAIQTALDKHARRYDVSVGVDHGDLREDQK